MSSSSSRRRRRMSRRSNGRRGRCKLQSRISNLNSSKLKPLQTIYDTTIPLHHKFKRSASQPSTPFPNSLPPAAASGTTSISDPQDDLRLDNSKRKHVRVCGDQPCTAVESSEQASPSNAWSKEQEVALHKAYYSQKPSSSFWHKVAKQVPGRTANECFHRFYSAHPTPPVQQSTARRFCLISPIKKFSKFLSPSRLILQTSHRANAGKSWSTESRKVIRNMLRKQQTADKGYEEDAFAALEQDSRGHIASMDIIASAGNPCVNLSNDEHGFYNLLSPTPLPHCAGALIHGHTEPFPRFGCTMKCQEYDSPEVLKRFQNMQHLDKYVDILICRQRATNLQKQSGKNIELSNKRTLACKTENLDVTSAKTAVIAGAREVLKVKDLKEKEIMCFDGMFDEDMDPDLQGSDDDDQDI